MEFYKGLRLQKISLVLAIVLLLVKIYAYQMSKSVAILSDALESIVNVLTAGLGLYSLYLASLPKDDNHPYGHGKVEFLMASLEGILVAVAGFVVLYEAAERYLGAHQLVKFDLGLALVFGTAIANYGMGHFIEKEGRKLNSVQLVSSGKHLKSDTYTTLGLCGGLLVALFSKFYFLDILLAIIAAGIMLYTAYSILKEAISGIMDEADPELIDKTYKHLEANRQENWVDLHNLRIIKYGNRYHFDSFLVLPWFLSVQEAKKETEKVEAEIQQCFGGNVELFVHTDSCLETMCHHCIKTNCPERMQELSHHETFASNRI
jgi:cation diffusion facilitator family transporter